jgi:hypothetical protein
MAVPVATPVTTPPALIVATPMLPELQVPPVVVSPSVIVCPVHTELAPVIAAGVMFTVTI